MHVWGCGVLHRRLAIIPQDPVLCSGTVRCGTKCGMQGESPGGRCGVLRCQLATVPHLCPGSPFISGAIMCRREGAGQGRTRILE